MKVTLITLLIIFSINSYSQQKVRANKKAAPTTTSPSGANGQPSEADRAPRQTITEKYLNGSLHKETTTGNTTGNSTGEKSPFAGGLYAGDKVVSTFDSATSGYNNAFINRRNATNATVAGGNDTTFNVNSINQNGVTTSSGAVDRSGQSQFGQTNWGTSRSTIGESQWTIPPPITASFSREFPAINNATWSRNNIDTSVYSARYQSGASWVTTTYSNAGQRLDTKTEIALLQPPRPVSVYLAKQPPNFQLTNIYFVQMQGKPDTYALTTRTGKTIYLNSDGMEINY
jgi:hypothetical protein